MCGKLFREIRGSDDMVASHPRTMRIASLIESYCTTEHDTLQLALMKITAEPATLGLESFLQVRLRHFGSCFGVVALRTVVD